MTRALVAVLALAACSCGFAQKHPAVTVGVVAGTLGFVMCAPAVEKQTTCLAIGAIAGLALGGITGLVTTFADTSAHELVEEPEPPIVRRKPRPATDDGAGPHDTTPPADPGAPGTEPP
jgi:hypothetical protein